MKPIFFDSSMCFPFKLHLYEYMIFSPLKGTLVFLLLQQSPLMFSNTYRYPWWAYHIGWFLATSSLSAIPLNMIWKLSKEEGTLWHVSVSLKINMKQGLHKLSTCLHCYSCCRRHSVTIWLFSPASQNNHPGCRWSDCDGKWDGKHWCFCGMSMRTGTLNVFIDVSVLFSLFLFLLIF